MEIGPGIVLPVKGLFLLPLSLLPLPSFFLPLGLLIKILVDCLGLDSQESGGLALVSIALLEGLLHQVRADLADIVCQAESIPQHWPGNRSLLLHSHL